MPPSSADARDHKSGQAWLWMMPTMAVAAFILSMIALGWLLQKRDFDQQMATLARDVQWAEQTLRLHLQGDQEFLQELANEAMAEQLEPAEFQARTTQYLSTNPHLSRLVWVDGDAKVRGAARALGGDRPSESDFTRGVLAPGYAAARGQNRPLFTQAHVDARLGPIFELFIPIRSDTRFHGSMVAEYPVWEVLRHLVPAWFQEKYHLAFTGKGGVLLAENSAARPRDSTLNYSLDLYPPGNGMRMQVIAHRIDAGFEKTLPLMLILGLSVLVVWTLWSLRNNLARRIRAEGALRAESNFRKTMEESMPTGMRAIDLHGRITHVNAAFCQMVGYEAEELVGAAAPFPYWHPDYLPEQEQSLRRSLSGDTPRGGIELSFRRKNGEFLDVRVYEAPLVDADGRQTGWMASIHDITAQKQARAELEASHQRFVTVLEGLDEAIYVAGLDTDAILFANKAFKSIYGEGAVGHDCWEFTSACQPDPRQFMDKARSLLPQQVPLELLEIELQNKLNGRWYQIRERAIQWVDGRVVRMQIATDITDRVNVEEMNRWQLDRLQQTSRLISMGEMASSLAHELNQPLAAIANYNMGCVNRLQQKDFRPEELLEAMEKASAQAERAGEIVRRVRDFARKSTPIRSAVQVAEVVDVVIGLAEVELRKAGVRIQVDIPPNLPTAYADKIMIEQVVLNLVKNAIEAMQDTPREARELTISARVEGQECIEVDVADRGPGVSPGQRERLFTPFYTTKPAGMGMGLNICRSIIEYHSGRLWTVANSSGGSVFSFTLPLGAA